MRKLPLHSRRTARVVAARCGGRRGARGGAAAEKRLARRLAEQPPVVAREPAEMAESPVERDFGHGGARAAAQEVAARGVEAQRLQVGLRRGVEVVAEGLVQRAGSRSEE